jgi:REP element-mobilizing transposase RayT
MASRKINRFRKSSLRLKDFDYSQEASYFITNCVFQHISFFGKIIFDKMILNNAGYIVKETLFDLENQYDKLAIDEYIIMPNHIHTIFILTDDIENRNYIRQTRLETEQCRNMIYQTRLETKNCRGLIYQTRLETSKGSINRTLTEKIMVVIEPLQIKTVEIKTL